LARILAWLHEKFTRNFSVGKDLWSLLKSSTTGWFFDRFHHDSASFVIIFVTNATLLRVCILSRSQGKRSSKLMKAHALQQALPPQAAKRPAAGGRL
jgi:hypothetical protein